MAEISSWHDIENRPGVYALCANDYCKIGFASKLRDRIEQYDNMGLESWDVQPFWYVHYHHTADILIAMQLARLTQLWMTIQFGIRKQPRYFRGIGLDVYDCDETTAITALEYFNERMQDENWNKDIANAIASVGTIDELWKKEPL